MSPSANLTLDSFQSAVLKVKWANKHISQLEQILASAREAGPYHFSANDDLEAKCIVTCFEFSQQALGTIAHSQLLIGDAIHNLRSALDHLAYQIMASAGEYPPRIYFPIDERIESFIGKSEFREIKRVAPDIADLIVNEIKPYGAGNSFVKLNQLDRIDKHRLIIVAAGTAGALIYAAKDDDDVPPTANDSFIVVAGAHTRLPKPGSKGAAHNERYSHTSFDISFGTGQPFENEAVVPTLHQLAQLVAGVINTMATYCLGQNHGDSPTTI